MKFLQGSGKPHDEFVGEEDIFNPIWKSSRECPRNAKWCLNPTDRGYTADDADACWGSGDRTGGRRWQRSVDRFTKSVSIHLSTGVEPRPNLNPGRGQSGQSAEEGGAARD